jgi:beta-galactosidase
VSEEDRSQACTDAAPQHFTLAMNASSCEVTGADGTLWEACRDYAPGSWGRVGGRSTTSRHRIFDTDDDALYQSTLEGLQSLRFDVPDGTYQVDVRFAETADRKPGERVFDVTVNGGSLATGLDLAASAGPFHAVTRSSQVTCHGRSGIRIDFRAARGEPTVSAVRVTRF